MGTKSRAKHQSQPVPGTPAPIKPKPIVIHDEGYRGAHPDDIKYPHSLIIKSEEYPSVPPIEIRAFSKRKLGLIGRWLEVIFLPVLFAFNLKLDTVAEKRSGGDKGGKRTLGVCFERDGKHAILLDNPEDVSRVAYTILHELAHINQPNHERAFREEFGRMLSWSINSDDEDFLRYRDDLIAYAKGDTYAPPVAPTGSWEDYPLKASTEVAPRSLEDQLIAEAMEQANGDWHRLAIDKQSIDCGGDDEAWISEFTSFDIGGQFTDEQSVRDYFTEAMGFGIGWWDTDEQGNAIEVFRPFTKEELTEMADAVIENRWHFEGVD